MKTCISFLKKIIKLETWKEYFEKNLPDILGICKLWYECNLLSIRKEKNSQFFEKQKAKNTVFCVLKSKKNKLVAFMTAVWKFYSYCTLFFQLSLFNFLQHPMYHIFSHWKKSKYPLRVRFVTSKEMKLKLFFWTRANNSPPQSSEITVLPLNNHTNKKQQQEIKTSKKNPRQIGKKIAQNFQALSPSFWICNMFYAIISSETLN